MIVIHGKGTQRLIQGVDCVTSSKLTRKRETWSRLGQVFAVVPPVDDAEVALANYIASHEVTAFVLHRGGVGLEFVRLLFGEDLTLRLVPYAEPPESGLRPLLEFLLKREVEHVIERRFPDPDTEWPEAGRADDEEERDGHKGRADSLAGIPERPPLQPLATLGRSTNSCAARVDVGAGVAVLLPLGKLLDAEDSRLLARMAAPPPRKVRIYVNLTDLKRGEATLQVDDRDAETRSFQRPAILAAFAKGRRRTIEEVGLTIERPASLRRKNPVGKPDMSATEIANRIDKLNKHFRDTYGLDFNVILTPEGATGRRELNRRVTLRVKGLPE